MQGQKPRATSTADMLSAALTYARRGWPVFPLFEPAGDGCSCQVPDCGSSGKHPRTPHGKDDATIDETTIRNWWTKWPNANIGLWCRDLVVVDVDPRNGGSASLESLYETKADQHGFETLEAVTGGGGRHYVFKAPSFPVSSSCIAPGVDIKAAGGYIVVAPSLHRSGRRYDWVDSEIDPQVAPAWLLTELNSRGPTGQVFEMPDEILVGRRNEYLFKLACSLRANRHLTPDEIRDAVLAKNRRACKPPLGEEEVRALVASACRHPAGSSWEQQAGLPDEFQDPTDDDIPPEIRAALDRPSTDPDKKVPIKPPAMIDGYTLLRTEYPPPVFVFDGLLHNGLTLLAGRPKVGKSWLALQLAIDAAMGRPGLARFVCPLKLAVLYCGLEESAGRTNNRMRKFIDAGAADAIQAGNIQFVHKLLPLFGGGLEEIEAAMSSQRFGLIIIDTLLKALGGRQRARNVDALSDDYKVVEGLQALAIRHQTSILVIHHTRKMTSDNSVDKVAGTSGLTAAADSIWTLDRGPKGIMLEIRGRDMADEDYSLRFDAESEAFGWTVAGTGDDVRLSQARWDILELLEESAAPMTPKAIAKELKKNAVTVRRLLGELRKDGKVAKTDDGYRLT